MRATKISKSYMDLIAAFALRPIRDDDHLEAAQKMLEKLVVRDESALDDGERDYLAVLTNLVEAYELEHYPMPTRLGTPVERLKGLMASAEITPAGLQKILDVSQTSVSLILNGKRGLSKDSIGRLARHFRLSADFFLAGAEGNTRSATRWNKAAESSMGSSA